MDYERPPLPANDDEDHATVLALACLLGWPACVAATGNRLDDIDIVVAGGKGGEAAWREWVAVNGGGDLTAIWHTLHVAKRMVDNGLDPGPPQTWILHAIDDLDDSDC
jgi:hypothetical protein